jgi:hypothetical protein
MSQATANEKTPVRDSGTSTANGCWLWRFVGRIRKWFDDRKLKEGTITNKWHVPASSHTSLTMVGKVMIPRTVQDPEEWKIQVEGVTAIGKRKTKTISVNWKWWNKRKIGERIRL